jgi:hypothetical protein
MQNRLSNEEDGHNLRCFDQKRRFGFDFLYPTERYVNALSRSVLCVDRSDLDPDACGGGRLLDNPLYVGGGRDPGLVYLGGIVGVPWQSIASDVRANQLPLGADELRFKTFSELSDGDWQSILGVPGVTPPGSPQMQESPAMRSGVDVGNPMNGRDYDTSPGSETADDLQYACIMPLPFARNCDEVDRLNEESCDCFSGGVDKPLCERFPGDGSPSTIQYWAKAYPGLRQLSVLHDYGEVSGNSVVASICARNVLNDQLPDFGYRPAMAAIVDRLKEKLSNRCLPRRLAATRGRVPCSLIEVRFDEPSCQCDESIARTIPDEEIGAAIRQRLVDGFSARCGDNDPSCEAACLCNVEQAGDGLQACQNLEDPVGAEGWCYVADTPDQSIGNPALVRDCPATHRRLLRFVGEGLAPNSLTFVACTGDTFVP